MGRSPRIEHNVHLLFLEKFSHTIAMPSRAGQDARAKSPAPLRDLTLETMYQTDLRQMRTESSCQQTCSTAKSKEIPKVVIARELKLEPNF